jgi:RHS repeat-associated protein
VLGDLETVDDPVQHYAAVYGYDGLQRLKTATMTIGGNTSPYTYSYDPLGNLLTKEGATQDYGRANLAGCASVSITLPHALTRRTAAGQTARDPYCYDAAGRLVSSQDTPNNSRRYAYFARGKLRSLQERVWDSDYAYDGDGVRVWRSERGPQPVEETVPFGVYRETAHGCEATYFVGAQAVARRLLARSAASAACRSGAGDDLAWFTDDHLGSTNLLTNLNGGLIASTLSQYLPFGEFATTPPQTATSGGRQFTSKRLDASGLYDFEARPYDPAVGRFTQADDREHTSGVQAKSPYTYVLNNPLALIDPSGHEECSECIFDVGEQIDVKGPEITPTWQLDLSDIGVTQNPSIGPGPPAMSAATTPGPQAAAKSLVFAGPGGAAHGIIVDLGASLCVIGCVGAVDAFGGLYLSPAGPNDLLFGDVHVFWGYGGAGLGLTPTPETGPLHPEPLPYSQHSDVQSAFGLSAGFGVSAQVFPTEANTLDAFGGYARQGTLGVGPVTAGVATNAAGQMTESLGVGVSKGVPLGFNMYNTYTAGFWPSASP